MSLERRMEGDCEIVYLPQKPLEPSRISIDSIEELLKDPKNRLSDYLKAIDLYANREDITKESMYIEIALTTSYTGIVHYIDALEKRRDNEPYNQDLEDQIQLWKNNLKRKTCSFLEY